MWCEELLMAFLAAYWYFRMPFSRQFWMKSVNYFLTALRRSATWCFSSPSISMALNYNMGARRNINSPNDPLADRSEGEGVCVLGIIIYGWLTGSGWCHIRL